MKCSTTTQRVKPGSMRLEGRITSTSRTKADKLGEDEYQRGFDNGARISPEDRRRVLEDIESKYKTRAEAAEAEVKELQTLFDIQHTRTVAADDAWRNSHPERGSVIPDLGELINWLQARAEAAEAEVKALRDALRDALHLQAVNISFLKKAIQAGAPKSELILRCDDIARAALDGST
jgi:hypothetical protein